jgi:hypothetical protein
MLAQNIQVPVEMDVEGFVEKNLLRKLVLAGG